MATNFLVDLASAYQNRDQSISELLPGAFGGEENLPGPTVPSEPQNTLKTKEGVVTYDVSKDYNNEGGADFDTSPSWCIAIFRLGEPLTYSRVDKSSIGSVISGVLSRKEKPLIITSECIQMSVSGSKDNCTETLNATLKGTTNYLSANALLPGDWMMAWIHTNENDTTRIVKALNEGSAANDFNSGLKFVGRVHGIRKNLSVAVNGVKTVTYTLQGIGFDELSTIFFYDPALASVESKNDIFQFMGQIGLDVNKWLSSLAPIRGQIKDNSEALVTGFLDIVVGKATSPIINRPFDNINSNLRASPQQNKEAPFSYLVPLSVATTLGRTITDEKKGNDFGHEAWGYGDLLTLLTGVQKYAIQEPIPEHKGFVPLIDENISSLNRLMCKDNRIKGTYVPIEQSFLNTPLWGLLNQFKNPCLNEMYTCIRPDIKGNLMPTVVFRQIPFSTNAVPEDKDMPLTRFMSLPRWKIPTELVTSLDLGKSNATHWNFIHVYGQLNPYHQEYEYDIAAQIVHNNPIADYVDMARSGIKPFMSTVNCTIYDSQRDTQAWMEAIADWNMGVQYTLNGTVNCMGIQSPIAKGDNIEIDGVVLHIDSVSHSCGINGGLKHFRTTLNLTHGMPVDQKDWLVNYPRYPGFADSISSWSSGDQQKSHQGDDSFATALNPGMTVDNK